jgi:hypothetical protein
MPVSTFRPCFTEKLVMIPSTVEKGIKAVFSELLFSIYYWMYFLLRPINCTNFSYSGECLKRGIDFYLIGKCSYLSAVFLEMI